MNETRYKEVVSGSARRCYASRHSAIMVMMESVAMSEHGADTPEGRPPDAAIQNISGLPQGLAGRTAAGWRRQGDGAGNKWRYERVCSADGIALSGGLP